MGFRYVVLATNGARALMMDTLTFSTAAAAAAGWPQLTTDNSSGFTKLSTTVGDLANEVSGIADKVSALAENGDGSRLPFVVAAAHEGTGAVDAIAINELEEAQAEIARLEAEVNEETDNNDAPVPTIMGLSIKGQLDAVCVDRYAEDRNKDYFESAPGRSCIF
eukprot:gene27564-10693_t